MTATLGVVFFGVLEGILIAVALSILMFFKRNWWPTGQVLGRVDSTRRMARHRRHPDAVQIPGVVVYRWEAPLFFANANMFLEEVRRLVRRSDARWLVVQCEAITDIDVTAADMLERLDDELNQRGVHLAVRGAAPPPARPRHALRAPGDPRPAPFLRLDRRCARGHRRPRERARLVRQSALTRVIRPRARTRRESE